MSIVSSNAVDPNKVCQLFEKIGNFILTHDLFR